jgi:hypothetical protein
MTTERAGGRYPYQRGGVAVCMEGPQFSTLPESLTYQRLGYDVIHMTSMPEAKLAREAEITYAVVAMVTDYDCWHEVHCAVDVASLLRVMAENNARRSECSPTSRAPGRACRPGIGPRARRRDPENPSCAIPRSSRNCKRSRSRAAAA